MKQTKISFALGTLLGLTAMDQVLADTALNVQDAQSQAAIAQSNATVAQSLATVANAQAVAQQSLLSSQLANQKSEIANIQSALQSPDGSKLKASSALAAPTVNAVYYRIVNEQIDTWLASSDATKNPTPITDANSCTSVFIGRPSLNLSLIQGKVVSSRLGAMWDTVNTATEDLKRTKTGKGFVLEAIPLAGVAAADALASLMLNVGAAMKQQTALGSQQLSSTGKIIIAAVQVHLAKNKKLYDPDAVQLLDPAASSLACKKDDGTAVARFEDLKDLPIPTRSVCVSEAISRAQDLLTSTKSPAPSSDPKVDDPNASARQKYDALAKALSQVKGDFQSIFAPDSASNTVPYLIGISGERFSRMLKEPGACILSLSAITSDADAVVRDGTFTSYKLSIATTTTVGWTYTSTDGQILTAGEKALSTKWEKQTLGDE